MRKNYHSLCQSESVLECVVNVSEGRDQRVLAALDAACGDDLLDRHTDRDHHRSVYTLVGEESVRALASHPSFYTAWGDPEVKQLIRRGQWLEAARHPRARQLLDDEGFQRQLLDTDLEVSLDKSLVK